MKTYVRKEGFIEVIIDEPGRYVKNCIPAPSNNDMYLSILKEIEAGHAVIVDYVAADSEKWDLVRSKRSHLLSVCDWRVLPDTHVNQEWLDYRQTLRDLPQSNDNPDAIIWPTPPAEKELQ